MSILVDTYLSCCNFSFYPIPGVELVVKPAIVFLDGKIFSATFYS